MEWIKFSSQGVKGGIGLPCFRRWRVEAHQIRSACVGRSSGLTDVRHGCAVAIKDVRRAGVVEVLGADGGVTRGICVDARVVLQHGVLYAVCSGG